MYVTPKYNYFSTKSKAQQVSLSCYLDDGNEITEKCKFELVNRNSDIIISKNLVKIGKNSNKSINKISVLYDNPDTTDQAFAMVYID